VGCGWGVPGRHEKFVWRVWHKSVGGTSGAGSMGSMFQGENLLWWWSPTPHASTAFGAPAKEKRYCGPGAWEPTLCKRRKG
jgi:hypothetical protein